MVLDEDLVGNMQGPTLTMAARSSTVVSSKRNMSFSNLNKSPVRVYVESVVEDMGKKKSVIAAPPDQLSTMIEPDALARPVPSITTGGSTIEARTGIDALRVVQPPTNPQLPHEVIQGEKCCYCKQ